MRVRSVATDGIITTYAGSEAIDYVGENIAPTSAAFNSPVDMYIDTTNNDFCLSTNNYRICIVQGSTGLVSTLAGDGSDNDYNEDMSATASSIDGHDGIYLSNFKSSNGHSFHST